MSDDPDVPPLRAKTTGADAYEHGRNMYDRMLAVMRLEPNLPNTHIAKKTGCGVKLVRKYREKGGPAFNQKPIDEVLERDRIAVRAAMARGTDAVIIEEKAKLQAVAAAAAEGEMMGYARDTASKLMGAFLRMAPGIQYLAFRLHEEMDKLSQDKQVSAGYLLKIIRSYVWTFKELTTATKEIIEMERTRLGEPSKVIGLQLQQPEDMNLEECMKEVEAAAAAVARARKKAVDHIDEQVH